MFNNITESYSHQDASLEILVMLLGAFLLGCLLGWLVNKYFCNRKVSKLTRKITDMERHNATRANSHASAMSTLSSINATNNTSAKANIKTDNLTKISGITNELQTVLQNKGINSFSNLRDINKETLTSALNIAKAKPSPTEIQSWSHQASLAEKAEWEKLTEYQSFMQRTLERNSKKDKNKEANKDDLKEIEGIGPKIEEILNNENILTYNDLKKSDRDTLKSYLDKAGTRFEKNEPETWPLQAGMAERGEWEELKIYQEFMDNDKPLFDNISSDKQEKPEVDVEATNKKADKADSKTINKSTTITKAESDDLKKIDGIGPKIQEILNKKGIYTFNDLSKSKAKTIKSYLDNAGSQFMMHDPETWPHQASLAAEGEWRKLDEYQDYMQASRELANSPVEESSKPSSSLHVKKDSSTTKALFDDLKRIEGIGPKIEQLLHKAGITSFEHLKNTNRSTIKALLDTAGPQFKMHNPDSWPHQAKMAAKGEWEKLEEYQDFLFGGRE